jgi:endoribonuclease Dicer
MSWHGYLQDLSQLIEPPLLDMNDAELIDSSLEELKTSCSADLTASTLAAMLMLNEAAPSNDKADGKAASIASQFTDGSDKENVSLTSNSTSTTLTALSPISNPPFVDNRRVEEGNLQAPALQSRGDPLEAVGNGTVRPTSISSHVLSQRPVNSNPRIVTTPDLGPQGQPLTPNTNGTAQAPSSSTISQVSPRQADKVASLSQGRLSVPSSHFQLSKKSVQNQSSSVMAALVVPTDKSFTSDTALATRTTEVVIEDLVEDRKRPGHDSLVNSSKRRQASYASEGALSTSTISDLPEVQFNSNLHGHVGKGKGSSGSTEDDEDYYDEDEEEDGLQPVPAARKLTQRKIRLNAIADNYMHDLNQKLARGGNKVRPEDEAVQSARWLVNQSENRQIISSPREYQVELFEKAKEKNVIAVLDTGLSTLEYHKFC